MKKLWSMIALGAALGLSVIYTPVNAGNGNTEPYLDINDASEEITVEAEFDNDGSSSELSGILYNVSGETSYDNVVVNIDFYDDQNTLIDTQYLVIDEDLAVGEDEDFKIGVEAPDGTESASWEVYTADEENEEE